MDGILLTSDGAVAVYTQGADLDTWTQSIIYPVATTGLLGFPNETVLRDMDGDGDLDIMVMDNFIAGWFTHFPAGIYYFENKGGDITRQTELGNKDNLPGRRNTDRLVILSPCPLS